MKQSLLTLLLLSSFTLLMAHSPIGISSIPTIDTMAPDIEISAPAGGKSINLKRIDCQIIVETEGNADYPTLPTPVFDPPGGFYAEIHIVNIICGISGVEIYYTLDGSEPDQNSLLYIQPIEIAETTTLKAKAYKEYWLASETAVAEYQIQIARFIWVEGGTFDNGTSNVALSSFYIDKYQTIQADYEAVMGANPSHFGGNPERPVEQVSWYNAIEYCNRRSIIEELTPCYSYGTYGANPDNWPAGWNTNRNNHINVNCDWTANGYRLPTEMEWMYAAKGGNRSQGYTYSGSNDVNAVARYDSNSGNTTHVVGSKLPNELGIYDMSGNVWEWCWDIWSNSYPSGSQTDPHGAASGSYRVLRGGDWNFYARFCTVSMRVCNATISSGNTGFRCVRASP
ncbi:MAG: SUMF1/EgtB/PvdO family nonheme iron enzyme [Candidatus Cloacimonetes bacterium]|nr:SUMF1/EgtB/PvdO family nonheme iron enzyme [Candidatus Cloacimonadota bacterium]